MRPGWFKGSALERTCVRINKPGQGEAVMSTQDGRAASPDTRDTNLTRRALIRAGWIIPAVLVVSLPSTAFADYGAPGGIPDPSVSTNGGVTVTAPGATVTVGGSVGANVSTPPPGP